MVLSKGIRKQMLLNELTNNFIDMSKFLESGLKYLLLLMLLINFLAPKPSKVF